MDREALVYVDLDGVPHLMGRLWARTRKNKESATFEYDKTWLENPARFSLEPALQVGPGPFHTPADTPMFGAIGDSAPDRWGRALMRRMERRRAEREGGAPRTLQEIDFLLLVDDEARQGALRFAEKEGGPFLREEGVKRIPPADRAPETALRGRTCDGRERHRGGTAPAVRARLLSWRRAAQGFRQGKGRPSRHRESSHARTMKSTPWSGKRSHCPSRRNLASPFRNRRVENIAGKPVLLLRRFDRDGERRIPFLSAMSMLGSKDRETRSYLEIVDALRQHGAAPQADMEALWRRLVFNILISNTDDHLRNHGFLYEGQGGWRLSPAYDLNPVPTDIKPRILSTAINEDDNTASLALAMEVAGYFELDDGKPRR